MKKWLAMAVVVLMALPACAWADEAPSVTGTVTEVEKYGHARLDITFEDFEAAGFALGDIVTVTAGTYMGDMPCLNGYYVDAGDYMVRANPGYETIAICINYGSFADVAGIDAGDPVALKLKEKAGALTLQEINNLVYTTDRADYTSDEVFANFRQVIVGGIGAGKLYRSASPVDNKHGRAVYAGPLMEAAEVRCVMNLANTPEGLEELFAEESFNNAYYRDLYDNGLVIALGMSINYASDEFAEGIVTGLTFLAHHDGPYLVHCTEGKDRAGFHLHSAGSIDRRFRGRDHRRLHAQLSQLLRHRSGHRSVRADRRTGCPGHAARHCRSGERRVSGGGRSAGRCRCLSHNPRHGLGGHRSSPEQPAVIMLLPNPCQSAGFLTLRYSCVRYTQKHATANTTPAGRAICAESESPSFAIRI
jgi:Uncharacterized conserved protein